MSELGAQFDEGYFERGERGGFPGYKYDSDSQRIELAKKLDCVQQVQRGGRIIFIGCAKGFEVKYFVKHGYNAVGFDISRYAITNAESDVAPRCYIYDGSSIPLFQASSVETVAAFDVLTLVPDTAMEKLAGEMCRVSSRWIIFRTKVKDWKNIDWPVDGMDGVPYRYRTFEEWCRLFESNGSFKLNRAAMEGSNRETVFYFQRV